MVHLCLLHCVGPRTSCGHDCRSLSYCRLGITLIFVIPRVPDFQFNADDPLTNSTSAYNKTVPTYFNRAPTNFSFPGAAQLQLDTGSSYLPVHIHNLQADVYDLQTDRHIGTGSLASLTLPAKKFTPLSLPLNFSYVAINTSDQTCEQPHYVSLSTRLTSRRE